ncbi:MAG: indole-3-glycerol phosphate synthase TrpC [Planctomycetes bacterium]|nr:indole-3-glycerol phosphate synthase TrpC [Planctomycetota bacterium]
MSETRSVENVLNQIIDHKRGEIADAKRLRPAESLQEQLVEAPPVRDFVGALRSKHDMALIAEVKKASPSAGVIRADFDPVAIARIYEQHGAACLSVLTDENFFQGHLDYLRAVRRAVQIPVLRKDFIIDRYQVLEARAAGADCILLIAECLDDCHLRDLYFYASELGMESLIEIYDPENLDRVLKLDPALVGVNNRDLRSFVTDLDHTIRLAPRLAPATLLVSESGIKTQADVDRLQAGGARAILVGETLMRSADIGQAVDELMGIR